MVDHSNDLIYFFKRNRFYFEMVHESKISKVKLGVAFLEVSYFNKPRKTKFISIFTL